ncbi:MAG: type III pantothenate kinase [Gammaproteobacteria bacterium]|nr:type III pantothenate kinase [Gammaproteobacteria bacterium]
MWLLLDAGNTRLKWRLTDGHRLLDGGAVRIGEGALVDRLHAAFRKQITIERVIATNVAGDVVGATIDLLASDGFGCAAEMLLPSAEYRGLKNGYTNPAALGADRWAAMIGARELVRGAVCIVDCGTAITLDWIDASGAHQGGMIIPGRRLMTECLVAGTRQIRLPEPSEALEGKLLGTDTASCVAAGTFGCVAGMVERTVQHMGKGAEVTCLVAGGDGAAFGAHLAIPHRIVNDLTFHGLLAFANG